MKSIEEKLLKLVRQLEKEQKMLPEGQCYINSEIIIKELRKILPKAPNDAFTAVEVSPSNPFAFELIWNIKRDQQLISLHKGGTTPGNIARIMGMTPGSIYSRMNKLRKSGRMP